MRTLSRYLAIAVVACGCTQETPAPQQLSLTTAPGGTSVQTAPLAAGAAAVAGQVTPTASCGGMSTQVVLYSNGNPLYQTTAPPYGNFEIQAMPGTYVVVAQAGNGCGTQQTVNLTAGQVAQVTLNLTPGGSGGTTGTVPPTTGTIPPCYYSYYGCAGGYYPGMGTVGFGKPNIYLEGAPGTEVKVGLELTSGSNLLVAAPALGPQGWDVKLGADGRKLVSGPATYDYLFYDLRTPAEKLTDRLAFCVRNGDLEPTLEKYLDGLGFQASEIKDFGDYWSKRFPAAETYCVYPQETEVADAVAPLHVSPAPARRTRVWFLVVPQKPAPGQGQTGAEVARFLKPGLLTGRDTMLARLARRKPATRGLASDGGFTLREWGVGLLFE